LDQDPRIVVITLHNNLAENGRQSYKHFNNSATTFVIARLKRDNDDKSTVEGIPNAYDSLDEVSLIGFAVNVSDAVKLFFRRSNHNDVVSHRWMQRNDTRLQIFGR